MYYFLLYTIFTDSKSMNCNIQRILLAEIIGGNPCFMAYWIDRALLWLLAAFSSLVFFLVMTDGRFTLSVPLAFAAILLLRILFQRLPEKHLFLRRKRLLSIESLLKKWAFGDTEQVISEIKAFLPNLFENNASHSVYLIQRLPDSEALTDNHLLKIRRAYMHEESVLLICTGPVSPSAAALAASLDRPSFRLADSRQLARLLLKSACPLPETPLKKERRRPLPACIARWLHSIRPVRPTAYAIIFFVLYQLTRSRFYLISSLIFFLQLIAYTISRMIEAAKAN